MATSTPWGTSQHSNHIARGIIVHSTSSHGGVHLSATRVKAIPEVLKQFMHKAGAITRKGDAWLEQDCNWAFAAIAFPSEFKPEQVQAADLSLRNWHPEAWEAFSKKQIAPGESILRDEQIFKERNKNAYVGIAAWGSWAEHVPTGMVGVCASVGGHRGDNAIASYWLVPDAEYKARDRNGFIIDPERHKRLNVVLGASKSTTQAEVTA